MNNYSNDPDGSQLIIDDTMETKEDLSKRLSILIEQQREKIKELTDEIKNIKHCINCRYFEESKDKNTGFCCYPGATGSSEGLAPFRKKSWFCDKWSVMPCITNDEVE